MSNYGSRSRDYDRASTTVRRETQAQYARRTGPILPMPQQRRGIISRVLGGWR